MALHYWTHKEQRATYPRIILHESAIGVAVNDYRSMSYHGPLGGPILRDEDGELFVSYLAGAWESEDEPPELERLERHAELIDNELKRFRGKQKILKKYVWAARYHNYICHLIPGAESYELRVAAPRLGASTLE
jgi:hypothetical protein